MLQTSHTRTCGGAPRETIVEGLAAFKLDVVSKLGGQVKANDLFRRLLVEQQAYLSRHNAKQYLTWAKMNANGPVFSGHRSRLLCIQRRCSGDDRARRSLQRMGSLPRWTRRLVHHRLGYEGLGVEAERKRGSGTCEENPADPRLPQLPFGRA